MAELWSGNKLVNPGAEAGDLSGWIAEGGSVADGGTEGAKCFRLAASAAMSQQAGGFTQPPRIRVGADFLPDEDIAEETEVKAYVRVECWYGDGRVDVFIFPPVAGIGAV